MSPCGRISPQGDIFIRNLEPETTYCVGLTTWVGTGEQATSVYSEESDRRCVTTAALAPLPMDLVLEEIRGREEREWSQVRGQAPAYLIALRNEGADADGTIVVDIQTSGVATIGEQPAVVRQGWESADFTCGPTPVSGGANAGLRCTGGSLKAGQRTNPGVAVQFTRAGYGYIHVSVSLQGGQTDTDPDNNDITLPIRIY
jgi:hypothetical protein